MKKKTKSIFFYLKIASCIFATLILIFLIWFILQQPSNDRNWTVDQQVLQYAQQEGELIHIYNVRNFTYVNTSLYTPAYYNQTYNLSELNSVWYIVEPFAEWAGSAHTFLSFGFKDEFLALSVEIRKEQGEQFSAMKGLFKQYELMYVLGDEKDLIKLRSNYRKDNVYLYPVNTSQETMRLLFLDVIQRVNTLYTYPEFYNTLTSTCTTNIARHANHIKPGRIPFNVALLAPGYSDKFAYELGILNTTLLYESIRTHYQINERAMKYANDSEFSLKIRAFE